MSKTTTQIREARSDDNEFIQSLAKGLSVIEAFDETNPTMTLSEVARKTRLTPGSARRVLHTLQQLGYATCDGNRFRLMPRVLQLGFSYLSSLPFASLVQPRLTELTEEMNGSCSVSVLDGIDVVYVARATAKRLGRDYMSVGTRYPAHATSAGKLMLAALTDAEVVARYGDSRIEAPTPKTIDTIERLLAELAVVRQNGWAINDQETMMGHRSIAVSLRVHGAIQASLGVGCNVSEVSNQMMIDDYLPKLLHAASSIENLMRIHEQSTGSVAYSAR